MKYQIINEEEYRLAVNIFKKYLSVGDEKKCFVGNEDSTRICKKDSIILGLSDSEALFDNCFYPLHNNVDINICEIIKSNLKQLVESDDIVEIFQAVRLIFTQNNYMKIYDELPFVIDTIDYVDILARRIVEKQTEMENYHIGEFAKFRKSMYEQVMNMLKKCEVK